jgi:hypothetical protein
MGNKFELDLQTSKWSTPPINASYPGKETGNCSESHSRGPKSGETAPHCRIPHQQTQHSRSASRNRPPKCHKHRAAPPPRAQELETGGNTEPNPQLPDTGTAAWDPRAAAAAAAGSGPDKGHGKPTRCSALAPPLCGCRHAAAGRGEAKNTTTQVGREAAGAGALKFRA